MKLSNLSVVAAPIVPLGTMAYYRCTFRGLTDWYHENANANVVKIRPRDLEQAGEREVNLAHLSNNDVHYWHSRKLANFDCFGDQHIRYEMNRQFQPDKAEGYQMTRVQVLTNGRIYENTRQALCLFCQEPKFFRLAGKKSLLLHMDMAHPHEIPAFVRTILDELKLTYVPCPHSTYSLRNQYRLEFSYIKNTLKYKCDGRSSPVRYSPRPQQNKLVVRLADVTEKMLVHWFDHDIKDFQHYQHRNVVYVANPLFDRADPQIGQILRGIFRGSEESGQIRPNFSHVLCLFCQQPTFIGLTGTVNMLGHIAGYHWGVGVPEDETVQELKRFIFEKMLRVEKGTVRETSMSAASS